VKIFSKLRFFVGILILIFLLVSYFIKFEAEVGSNYLIIDNILGVIIFHNFFIFSFYILLAAFLILTGLKRIKFT